MKKTLNSLASIPTNNAPFWRVRALETRPDHSQYISEVLKEDGIPFTYDEACKVVKGLTEIKRKYTGPSEVDFIMCGYETLAEYMSSKLI